MSYSSAFRWIPGIVTADSGNVTGDSGKTAKIGHVQMEFAVTFARNGRSRSGGIVGHVRAEYAASSYHPTPRITGRKKRSAA